MVTSKKMVSCKTTLATNKGTPLVSTKSVCQLQGQTIKDTYFKSVRVVISYASDLIYPFRLFSRNECPVCVATLGRYQSDPIIGKQINKKIKHFYVFNTICSFPFHNERFITFSIYNRKKCISVVNLDLLKHSSEQLPCFIGELALLNSKNQVSGNLFIQLELKEKRQRCPMTTMYSVPLPTMHKLMCSLNQTHHSSNHHERITLKRRSFPRRLFNVRHNDQNDSKHLCCDVNNITNETTTNHQSPLIHCVLCDPSQEIRPIENDRPSLISDNKSIKRVTNITQTVHDNNQTNDLFFNPLLRSSRTQSITRNENKVIRQHTTPLIHYPNSHISSPFSSSFLVTQQSSIFTNHYTPYSIQTSDHHIVDINHHPLISHSGIKYSLLSTSRQYPISRSYLTPDTFSTLIITVHYCQLFCDPLQRIYKTYNHHPTPRYGVFCLVRGGNIEQQLHTNEYGYNKKSFPFETSLFFPYFGYPSIKFLIGEHTDPNIPESFIVFGVGKLNIKKDILSLSSNMIGSNTESKDQGKQLSDSLVAHLPYHSIQLKSMDKKRVGYLIVSIQCLTDEK